MDTSSAFLITVGLGIFVGLILYVYANTRGHVQTTIKSGDDQAFAAAIRSKLDQIGVRNLDDSTVKELSSYFDEELEKQKNVTQEEITKKYEAIVEDKKQALKAANEKVKAVRGEIKSIGEKYDKVSTQKNQTESILRSVAEGMIVVDNQGKVLMMNPAAEKLLGSKKEDKLGKDISDGKSDDKLISLVKGGPDPDENEQGKEIEVTSDEDSTKKVIRSSTAVIENEDGQTVGMVSVLTDVTKQRELEQMKADFISKF